MSKWFCCFSVAKSVWLCYPMNCSLPCPSLSPWCCSDSCPLSWWCYLNILSCHFLLLLPSVFPSIRVFSNESALPIRWPKYWSFGFCSSPSNEYSGLISFRIAWFGLLAVQGTLKSLLPGEVGGLIQNYTGIHWGVRGPAQLRKGLMQNSCCGLNMNFPNVCWILTVKA